MLLETQIRFVKPATKGATKWNMRYDCVHGIHNNVAFNVADVVIGQDIPGVIEHNCKQCGE